MFIEKKRRLLSNYMKFDSFVFILRMNEDYDVKSMLNARKKHVWMTVFHHQNVSKG